MTPKAQLITAAALRFAALVTALTLGLVSLVPATASDLTAGVEFPVGGVRGPAPSFQETPAIAQGGTGYLVVWQDKRNVVNQGTDSDTHYDIYGILLDSEGQIVSAESFLISTVTGGSKAPNDQHDPAVAWNGSSFLVVWSDRRAADQQPHIYGARVTTSGQVLDANGFAISATTAPSQSSPVPVQYYPAVASNGTDWQVVWQENPGVGGFSIYGARITAAGAVTARGPISFGSDNKGSASIAWNGSNYVVVWEDQRNSESTGTDIYGCRVSATGAKVGSDVVISTQSGSTTIGAPGNQLHPSVAVGVGGMALAAWDDSRAGTRDVYFTRINSTGVVQNLGGVALHAGAGNQDSPSVGYDGTQWDIVWRDSQSSNPPTPASLYIRGGRVGDNGQILSASPFLVAAVNAGNQGPAISGLYVVFNSTGSDDKDVYGVRLTYYGGIVSTQTIAVSSQNQPSYNGVWNGNGYTVVWSDGRNGQYQIYAARVDVNGIVLDPQGVAVTGGSIGAQTRPSIAWNGSNYLVVWQETGQGDQDVQAVRLNANLQIVGSQLNIANAEQDQTDPAVAWNGTKWLVVWADQRSGVAPTYFTDILGCFASTSGVVTMLPGPVSGATGSQYAPSVATDGTDFMVAWEDNRSGGNQAIFVTRVLGSSGSVSPSQGLQLSTVESWKMQPAIAYDGTAYAVVWGDARTNWISDIFGARVSKTATLLQTDIAIAQTAGEQSAPTIAWAGQNYLVTWQDSRTSGNLSDIYYIRMGSNGVLLDGAPTVLTASPLAESNPVVLAGTNAQTIFYQKFLYSLNRIVAKTLNEVAPVPVADIQAAKALADGTKVSLTGKPAIAGTDQLGGVFYIEELDRSAGIRVATSQTVNEGNYVTVVGTIETAGSERQITASSVTVTSPSGVLPNPFPMRNFSVGGTGLLVNTTIGTAWLGANNVGMLVQVAGVVSYVGGAGEDFIYVTDGRALSDGSGKNGLKVLTRSLTKPTLGSVVKITGVASSASSGSQIRRQVLVRKAGDILIEQVGP